MIRRKFESFGSARRSSFRNLFLIVGKKRVKARRGGLVLGELKISIISTFIEYIGRVSKAVYK